ncbi:hypothetical protein IJ674_08430 [bacterium]|nr:hypothetical protein [bacterium]
MKIISDYGIRTNKNNYSTKVSFSGLTSKSIVKTVYPEVVSNAMNNACAKIIAELNIGSKKVMNETDKFIKLREDFSPALDSALRNEERTAWDFYINSNPKNMKAYETAQEEFSQLFSNKETYEKFLSIDSSKLPKHEQKQLKDLLKIFDKRINTGEIYKALEKKENDIAQKYNSYVPTIDGKEVSKSEISKIIQTESNPELRQKAYDALIKGGDLIADDMIEFAKMRNEFAKTKGYDNFFDYQLKEEFDVETPFLNRLIDQVYSGAKDKIKAIQEKTYAELRQIFKTENLQGCHYGLLTDSNPAKAVNKILENYSIEDISKKAYAGMGYDVDKMIAEGNLTLDLYPRKGKNTHGFCFGIDPGKDSRILANLRNDALSLDTLNHEMGHCVYDLGISRGLPVIDRAPASSAFTEAIAMMMGDLPKRENILKNIIPEKFLVPFKKSISEDEANFVSKSLLIIDFERELYKNPNQNPAKLWADLRLKYRNQNHAPNNEWATIPHYLSHPGYYQNYFRASLMKTQIYNHLQGVLGNITENTQTAKYLKDNIFSKGASVEEYDLIKQLTGKEFSANDYIQTL